MLRFTPIYLSDTIINDEMIYPYNEDSILTLDKLMPIVLELIVILGHPLDPICIF